MLVGPQEIATDQRLVWVVGYARSGTNWLSRMIADALGSYAYDEDRLVGQAVGKMHWTLERPRSGHVVYIYRDPRDVIVSLRDFFGWPSYDDLFSHEPAPGVPGPLEGLALYHSRWLYEIVPGCLVRFERLHEAPDQELARVLKCAGLSRVAGGARTVAMRHTYNLQHDRFELAGLTDSLRQMGTGKVGRWRTDLTRDAGQQVHEWLYPWLVEFGYEDNPHWWEALPE